MLLFNPKEDVCISATEVLPGAKEIVHHVGIYLDTEGVSPKLDDQTPGLGFPTGTSFVYDKILDLWTPGGTPTFMAQVTGLNIPAGAKNYEVTAKQRIRRDIHIVSVWPHMHKLGQEMKVWETLPDKTTQPIIWVQDYDFNWQQVYVLKEPLALPRGSSISLVAYYDNSEDNPKNPYRNPRTIRFGQRANDEMCYFYYYHTVDAEHLTQGQEVDN